MIKRKQIEASIKRALGVVKVRSLDEWRDFMNGYRDPKTIAADEAKLKEYFDENLEPNFSIPGSGGAEGERECGFRVDGGTYAVVPRAANGKPVEYFVLCNPIPIDKEEYGLQNIGVRLRDVKEKCLDCNGRGYTPVGNPLKLDTKLEFSNSTCNYCGGTGKVLVTHVFDIVGREAYPNIADFLEEVRRLGVSRRLELEDANQYARLTSRSRLILLHERAVIKNAFDIFEGMRDVQIERLIRANCPKHLDEHNLTPFDTDVITAPGCAALYWNTIEGGEVIPELRSVEDVLGVFDKAMDVQEDEKTLDKELHNNFVKRKLKSGTYRGYQVSSNVKPVFSLGIFAVFPLAQIHVVDSSGEYGHRVERASSAKVDVLEVEC